jgi:hypothetical protein
LHLSPKSRAVYVHLDMGDRQPKPDEAEILASVFGWPDEDAEAAPESGEAALVAAIRELVEELRLSRLEQAQWNKGVQDVLAVIGARVSASPTGDREREPLASGPR